MSSRALEWRPSRELVLYAAIGATGATLDLLLFLLFTRSLGIYPVVATAVSVSAGIVNNFIWNALITFKVRTRLFVRFLSFYAVGMVGVIASMGIVWLFTEPIALGSLVAKAISIPPVVLGQFWVNRHVAFGSRWNTSTRADADVPA